MPDHITRFSERQENVMRRLIQARRSLRRGEVSAEAIITSVCTTLETACTDLLDDLLEAQAAQTDSELERAMIRVQKADMTGSWHSRLKWLSKGFSKNLDKDVAPKLSAMIELRNAIAHNGDAFTPRQMAKYADFLSLRQILELQFDVTINGTRFRLGENTGDKVIDVGRQVAIKLL